MQISESKTASVAKSTKANKPFFSKKGEDSFFGKRETVQQSFFNSSDSYSVNGNGILQTKLNIGKPNDKYEKEADAMADKVVQRLREPDSLQKEEDPKELPERKPEIQEKPDFETEISQKNIQAKPYTDKPSATGISGPALNPQVDINTANGHEKSPSSPPVLQTKCNTCEKEEEIEKEEPDLQRKPIFDGGADNLNKEDEFMAGRSWEEEQADKVILFKLEPNIQLQGSSSASDETTVRNRIEQVAREELGKVEAKRADATGRRVGYERLLEYFHLAAPNEWPDEVIEFAKYGEKHFPHWCAIFAVYAIKKAGIDVGDWKMGTGVSQFNTLQQTDVPQKGDIGYIHEPYRHHCIVIEVNGDTVRSIDGNSGPESGVKERERPIDKYTGFFTAFTGSEKYIQKKEESNTDQQSGTGLKDQLRNTTGKGSPMDEHTKGKMEAGFGMDFNNVNIHTDHTAVEMNKSLHAQAFTHGSDIYFNEGKYNPATSSGKHLLAHELTHTVQQGYHSIGKKIQKSPLTSDENDNIESRLDLMIALVERFLPDYSIEVVEHLETLRADFIDLEHENYANELSKWDTSIETLGEVIRLSKILPVEDAVIRELRDPYDTFKSAIEETLLALGTERESESLIALTEAQTNYLNQFTRVFLTLSDTVLDALPSADTIDQEGYFVNGVYLTEVNGRMEFASTSREYTTLSYEIATLQEEIDNLGDLHLISLDTPESRLGFLLENGDKLLGMMQRVKALTLIHICFNIGNQFLEYVYGDYHQRWTDLVLLIRLRDEVIKPLLQASSDGKVPTDDQIASAQRIAGSPEDFVSAAEGRRDDITEQYSLFAKAGSRIRDVIQFRERMEIFIAIASTVVGLRAMAWTAKALQGASGLVRFTLSSLAFTSASTATRSLLTGRLPTLGQVAKQAGLDLVTFGLLKGAHHLVGLRFGGVQNVPEGLLHGTTFATLWTWSAGLQLATSEEELSAEQISSVISSTGVRLAIELPLIILINKGLDAPAINKESDAIGRTVEQEWNTLMEQTRKTANELKSWMDKADRSGTEGERILRRMLAQFTQGKTMLSSLSEVGAITREQATQIGEQMGNFIRLGNNTRNALRLGIKPASDYGFFYQGRSSDIDMFLRRLQAQGEVESIRTANEAGDVFEVRYSDGSIRFFFPEGANPADTVIDIDLTAESLQKTAPQSPENTRSNALANLRNFAPPEVNQIALAMENNGTPEIVYWLARSDVDREIDASGSFISSQLVLRMINQPEVGELIESQQADKLRAWYDSGFEAYRIGGYTEKTLNGYINFLHIIEAYYGTLDVTNASEARAIVSAYRQSAEGRAWQPTPERRPAVLSLPGTPVNQEPYSGPGDYLTQNGLTEGEFIKASFDDVTWIIRVQNGQANMAWKFPRNGYPPTQELNLLTEIQSLDSEVDAIESMAVGAPGREAIIESLRDRANKLVFLGRIRGNHAGLTEGINALIRAQRYTGGETLRPRADVSPDIVARRNALIGRKNQIRQRATLAGLLDDGIIQSALNRRPGAVVQDETFAAIEVDFQAAENMLNELSEAAIDRTIKRIGAEALQHARSGELSSLTDQQVGDVLNMVKGKHGINESQMRGLLFAYKDGLRVGRIFELERSATERNFVLESFAGFRDSNIVGATEMMRELLASSNKWRGGVWAMEYIRDHLSLEEIAKFERIESLTRTSDPSNEAVRVYDIVLKDGRHLEMKDWTNWFPSSLKSQFKRDVIIRTTNFTDPYGLYEMQYLFRWPGPQIAADRSLTVEETTEQIKDLLYEGLLEVMEEEFVDFATQDLLEQIFENHYHIVEIVESLE